MKQDNVSILVITSSDAKSFIFPKTKTERISFTAKKIGSSQEMNILSTSNVKYFIKRFLHTGELWKLEGKGNNDNSSFYVERALKLCSQEEYKELARVLSKQGEEEGK